MVNAIVQKRDRFFMLSPTMPDLFPNGQLVHRTSPGQPHQIRPGLDIKSNRAAEDDFNAACVSCTGSTRASCVPDRATRSGPERATARRRGGRGRPPPHAMARALPHPVSERRCPLFGRTDLMRLPCGHHAFKSRDGLLKGSSCKCTPSPGWPVSFANPFLTTIPSACRAGNSESSISEISQLGVTNPR
jgi:hypothetical protein